MKYRNCQKGKQFYRKTRLSSPVRVLLILYQQSEESFAFTSNVDDGGGSGSLRENEGGLRSSCTS